MAIIPDLEDYFKNNGLGLRFTFQFDLQSIPFLVACVFIPKVIVCI